MTAAAQMPRILVVDDSEAVRTALEVLCRFMGRVC